MTALAKRVLRRYARSITGAREFYYFADEEQDILDYPKKLKAFLSAHEKGFALLAPVQEALKSRVIARSMKADAKLLETLRTAAQEADQIKTALTDLDEKIEEIVEAGTAFRKANPGKKFEHPSLRNGILLGQVRRAESLCSRLTDSGFDTNLEEMNELVESPVFSAVMREMAKCDSPEDFGAFLGNVADSLDGIDDSIDAMIEDEE